MQPYFKEKWDAFTLTIQKRLQIVAGCVLAAACWLFISLPSSDSSSFVDFNMLIAIAIAVFGPRLLDSLTGADLRLMRKAMLIALTVCLAGSMIYTFLIKPRLAG